MTLRQEMDDLWVFGYGSLMWRPGFEFLEKAPALLTGLHRSLCVYSWIHRGTPQRPGLVLGLDEGGECYGVAFRVGPHNKNQTLDYLREREQGTGVYLERFSNVEINPGSGKIVSCLNFVVDRDHRQYAGRLTMNRQLEIVRNGVGQSGINREYVLNTVQHLRDTNVNDPDLYELSDLLEAAEIN